LIVDSLGDAWQYRPHFQLAAFALGLIYSLRKGAGPERVVAVTLVAMALADRIYHELAPHASAVLWHFLLDFAASIALVGVGLFANRIYTLWIGSFQIIALSAHLVRFVATGEQLTLAFTILYILPSYFQIGLLLLGTHLHARRVRRSGPYRSWKSFSHPSRVRGHPR
jgi:hypothetical protein